MGAGVLRGLVWGELHGGFEPRDVRDVDVAYFEASDLRPQRDQMAEDLLRRLLPGEPWQAKNQAAVHTWYSKRFQGDAFAPVHSIAEAVARWPETATAVAVRLGRDRRLEICAPLGLGDLLGGVWRRNPKQVSIRESQAAARTAWGRSAMAEGAGIPPTESRGDSDWGAAGPWDAEYRPGRYRHEPPLAFVDDILAACRKAGLASAPGLYIG